MSTDTQYLEAVSRGDLATAQRMVDEAARKAGAINEGKLLYHGGNRAKTSFARGSFRGMGLAYLTDSKRVAWKYAMGGGIDSEKSLADYRREQLKKLPSREPVVQKLIVIGDVANFSTYQDRPTASRLIEIFGEKKMSDVLKDFSGEYRDAINLYGEPVENVLETALNHGWFINEETDATAKVPELQFLVASELFEKYLNAIKKNIVAYDDAEAGGTTYVVFDPGRVKSADPVTYDDAGNVIPLSRRFDVKSDDIRNPRRPAQTYYVYTPADGNETRDPYQPYDLKRAREVARNESRRLRDAGLPLEETVAYVNADTSKAETVWSCDAETCELRNPLDPRSAKKQNPAGGSRNLHWLVRQISEPEDRVLDYAASRVGDLYHLYDLVYAGNVLSRVQSEERLHQILTEIEGLLDDRGVFLFDYEPGPVPIPELLRIAAQHFKEVGRVKFPGLQGTLYAARGPLNPEEARINAEKERRK